MTRGWRFHARRAERASVHGIVGAVVLAGVALIVVDVARNGVAARGVGEIVAALFSIGVLALFALMVGIAFAFPTMFVASAVMRDWAARNALVALATVVIGVAITISLWSACFGAADGSWGIASIFTMVCAAGCYVSLCVQAYRAR